MIVDVPFVHRATVHRSRKKSPDAYEVLKGTVTLDVREATAAEAPVAMWWVSPRFNKDPYRADTNRQVSVRSFEGKLYEPMRAKDEATVVDPETLALAARPTRSKKDWEPPVMSAAGLAARLESGSATEDSHNRLARTTMAEELRRKSVVTDSDHEEVAARVSRMVAQGIVVDGVAYRQVGRPMYAHQLVYRHQLAPVHAFGCRLDCTTMIRPEDYVEQVARMRKAKLQVDPADIKAYRPDVIDADLLAFDMDAWMVDNVARAIVAELACRTSEGRGGTTKLAGYDRPTIMAYGRLRDAIDAGRPTEELVGLLEEFGTATRPHGTLLKEWRGCESLAERLRANSDDASVVPVWRR